MESESDWAKTLVGQMLKAEICTLVLIVTAWTVLVYFVPWTWLIVTLNIGFLLVALSGAVSFKMKLDLFMPGIAAWLLALVVWAVGIILLRSIEVGILDAITS